MYCKWKYGITLVNELINQTQYKLGDKKYYK